MAFKRIEDTLQTLMNRMGEVLRRLGNVETILGSNASSDLDDTGWIDITSGYASGFTTGSTPGQLSYRVRHGIVYWRGGVNGTIASGVYTTVLTGFPAAARPAFAMPHRQGASFSGATPGFVEFHADGHIVVAQSSGANKVWAAWSISYPRG